MVGPLFTAFALIAAGQAKPPPISAKDFSLPIARFERSEDDESGGEGDRRVRRR